MIPLYEPFVKRSYAKAVAKQVQSGWWGPGLAVRKFEETLAEYVGAKYAVCVNSGTTALYIALKALELPLGSKVLFPAYGMLAGANAARLAGYEVSLVDINPDTLCMGFIPLPMDLERDGPYSAIIHLNNCATKTWPGPWGTDTLIREAEAIRYACESLQIKFIADNCWQLGIQQFEGYDNPLCDTVGIYSFSVPKLITTGQGGAVVTNDFEFANKIRNLSDHGGDWRKDRIHKRIGGNFRMTDIQAALGLEQFKYIDELINRRKQVHRWYSKYIPLSYDTNGDGCFVIYESPVAPQLISELRNRGIEASRLYQPVHFSEPFKEPEGTYPNAERAAKTLVYLPYSLGLTKRQVATVCKAVIESEISILSRKGAA